MAYLSRLNPAVALLDPYGDTDDLACAAARAGLPLYLDTETERAARTRECDLAAARFELHLAESAHARHVGFFARNRDTAALYRGQPAHTKAGSKVRAMMAGMLRYDRRAVRVTLARVVLARGVVEALS